MSFSNVEVSREICTAACTQPIANLFLSGHVDHISDKRLPKLVVYENLGKWQRPTHKLNKRYKDGLKESMKRVNITIEWIFHTNKRSPQRKNIHEGKGSRIAI